MECELASLKCEPCRGGIPPLKGEELNQWHQRLGPGWELVDEHHLTKTYQFDSFRDSLNFVLRAGELAEEVGHHPEIHLNFRKVILNLWTHKIDGLAEADFIWAAKVDALLQN